jgi:phosphatidate cytidylyltransferase
MYGVIMFMVNSMKKRVISAIIALIIVVPIILIGGYAYYIGVGIISVIGLHELLKVREEEKKIPMVMKGITLLTYLAIVMSAISTQGGFSIDYRLFILNMFACLIPLIAMERKKYDAEDALFVLAATLFLGISFNFLIVIRNMSLFYLLYVVLITIMSDTFAHFWGTKIGSVKLCPNVSPNKTVEGMIGGTIFGTFIGAAFFLTFINPNASVLLIGVISLALSLVAQFGDLVFSAIKRRYGVKDYGNIMPGHGGVLDRLDSIIFAILAFSYLVAFF